MKICTILGTRPEIIRLSQIMPKLDEVCEHHILWTGQNYDPKLNDIFWDQLGLRSPDTILDSKSKTFGGQVGKILEGVDATFEKIQPDKVLILGDTNSGLSAMVARRRGIPVYHMEAGNRCFDNRVPEEANRRQIDHISAINMPYTNRSRDNLLREGFPLNQIVVTGNPIAEVLDKHKFCISLQKPEEAIIDNFYFLLATFHRAENVDCKKTLHAIVGALDDLATEFSCDVLCSVHPRTRQKLEANSSYELNKSGLLHFCEPFGFFDFIALENRAQLVLTDSGTVQEECAINRTPCVVMRRSTERIECVEAGASIVAGTERQAIVRAARTMLKMPIAWELPEGYADLNVSQKVVNCLQGSVDGF